MNHASSPRIVAALVGALYLTACSSGDDTADPVADEPAPDAPVAEAPAPEPEPEPDMPSFEKDVPTETETGLTVVLRKKGTGTMATPGDFVTVHYTGWLYDEVEPDKKGDQFDSSRDRDEPFRFALGMRRVISGWDEGVAGMRVGEQRTLIIPPDLAYGKRGAGDVIPPSATLLFDVELLGVEQ